MAESDSNSGRSFAESRPRNAATIGCSQAIAFPSRVPRSDVVFSLPSQRVPAGDAVLASDTKAISSVGFYLGARQIGRVRENSAGVYSLTWSASGKGKRVLSAVVSDTAGREAEAKRVVRVCG